MFEKNCFKLSDTSHNLKKTGFFCRSHNTFRTMVHTFNFVNPNLLGTTGTLVDYWLQFSALTCLAAADMIMLFMATLLTGQLVCAPGHGAECIFCSSAVVGAYGYTMATSQFGCDSYLDYLLYY